MKFKPEYVFMLGAAATGFLLARGMGKSQGTQAAFALLSAVVMYMLISWVEMSVITQLSQQEAGTPGVTEVQGPTY